MNHIASCSVVNRLKIKLATFAVLLLISFAGSVLLYSFIMAVTGFVGLLLHVISKILIDTAVFDLISLVAFVSSAVLGLVAFLFMSKGAVQAELPEKRLSRPDITRMNQTVQPRAERFSVPVR